MFHLTACFSSSSSVAETEKQFLQIYLKWKHRVHMVTQTVQITKLYLIIEYSSCGIMNDLPTQSHSVTSFSVHVFLRSSKPPRVEHTTRHERLRGSYQQHTFTSLLICTQWVPVTWQHKHERERIWKCNRTEQRFPDLNEQYKVSLCSISHVQGYSGPAWTHTVLVLSASKLIQP